jgi:hypothetical protein
MNRPAPLFILSTGRSGTTSIANMLSAVPGVVIVHERRPKLLEEAVAFRRGNLEHSALVDLLRSSRDPASLGATLLAGESNQRLSFVLPALAEAFPTARYVLLQRDGREVVDSVHHRWWYHPREAWIRHPSLHVWASTRFQGPDFGLPGSEWDRMTPFARCCWYWALVPRLVRSDAERLGLRLLEIRLEDLEQSRDALETFLELPPGSLEAPPRANATKSTRASWRSWSASMRHDFERFGGAEMDRCYPGWRAEFQWSTTEEIMGFGRRLIGIGRSAKAHINAFTGRRGRATDDEGGNP